ncbi:MAG: hypothetical protein KDD62_10175 [Bdellovibrionales bacterium]|nr:hypothetical protein [Bdellovibrionales bacterium]
MKIELQTAVAALYVILMSNTGHALDLTNVRLSINVIDLRNAAACEQANNCRAGFVDECNPNTCTQTFNTGLCKTIYDEYGDFELTSQCQTRTISCEDTSLCVNPPLPLRIRTSCTKNRCPIDVSACDILTGLQKVQTGECNLVQTSANDIVEQCQELSLPCSP